MLLIFKSFWRAIKPEIPLLIILCFALSIRLFNYLGVVRGDDFDYSLYAYQVSQGLLDSSSGGSSGSNRPGVYLPVAMIYKIFGVSEFSATLFPLLASLITIIFIYLTLRQIADKPTALVGAFLWSIFPLDVFLATNLDPEGPLAMATAGAVYFFLQATHRANNRKLINSAVSIIFVYWALQIKLSATPLLIALAVLVLFRSREKIRSILKSIPRRFVLAGILIALSGFALLAVPINMAARPLPILINNIELTAYDVLPAWLTGRSNTVYRDIVGKGNWASNRREAIVSIPVSGKILSETSQRFVSFDPFILLALVGAAHAIVNKDKRAYVPLIWLGTLLFYLEWGSFPTRFAFPQLLIYSPLLYWVAEDNFLYLAVPLVLVVSLYLTKVLRGNSLRSIYIGIVCALGTVLLLANWPTSLPIGNLPAAGLLLTVIYAAVSARLVRVRRDHAMLAMILPVMAIATLMPSAHYSSVSFYKEKALRENLRLAIGYMEDDPEELIYAPSVQPRLDFYSGYKYSTGTEGGETLFTTERELVEQNGGYEIMRGRCDQPAGNFNEWPTVTFGEPSSDECISVTHHLSARQASEQLERIRSEFKPNNEYQLVEFLQASAQAEDTEAFFATLSLYVDLFPDTAPIQKASLLATEAVKSAPSEMTETIDLLKLEASDWLISPLLGLSFSNTENGNDRTMVIALQEVSPEAQTASIQINLEPKSIYLLELEAQGSLPIDLVRFPDLRIPDSYGDHWEHNFGLTSYSIIFVTPPSLDSSELTTLELFRVYDHGSIEFRSINLTRVPAGGW
ncbi:MAG: glycosyltransferase family 39 protein [Anaerolineales bacterium]|nr:glycosyltransferase family 39 protein [Anaerolineales bacterium]